MKKLLVFIPLIIATIGLSTGCVAENTAKDIAKQWVEDEIDTVSTEIANWLVEDDPIFQEIAASAISDLISDNIRWEFSNPKKIDTNISQVIATGRSTINIPLIGEYTISADFKILVDVNQEKVVDSTFDTTSVRIVEGSG